MNQNDDFKKFATKHRGISSLTLHNFTSAYNSYISPTIIEERQLNVASMDVFSRLMMDRIFTGWKRTCRSGNLRYDAVHFMRCCHDMHRNGRLHGSGIAGCRNSR